MTRWIPGMLALSLLATAGCGVPAPAGEESTTWRLLESAPLKAEGRFLVSPRWALDGRRLVAAGRGGVGLVLVDSVQGSSRTLSSGHRWPARLTADLGIAPPEAPTPDGFAILSDAPGFKVRWKPYDGRLLILNGAGERVLAEAGAWGVTVSPDRRRVAWCEGHLPVAGLNVADANGHVLYSGPGAQPDWLPDSSGLVFSHPRSQANASGRPVLSGASVALLDLSTLRVHRLTDRPGSFHMQPVVSPDGERLAFADWRTGRVWLARLREAGDWP